MEFFRKKEASVEKPTPDIAASNIIERFKKEHGAEINNPGIFAHNLEAEMNKALLKEAFQNPEGVRDVTRFVLDDIEHNVAFAKDDMEKDEALKAPTVAFLNELLNPPTESQE